MARSRCAEDALASAVAAGVEQFVVLGAGLDTFAYRNPFPPPLRVFEIDHPATQSWKRRLLAQANIAEPPSLTFVPVNFETDRLADRLESCGFHADRPAFFSWLGVSMYLTRESVLGTLRWVSTRPNGSGITFDYIIPPQSLPFLRRIGFYLLARRVAAAGEPWRTWFDPPALEVELRDMGFSRVEDLDQAALNERYFAGREGRLGGRSAGRVVTAWR